MGHYTLSIRAINITNFVCRFKYRLKYVLRNMKSDNDVLKVCTG